MTNANASGHDSAHEDLSSSGIIWYLSIPAHAGHTQKINGIKTTHKASSPKLSWDYTR